METKFTKGEWINIVANTNSGYFHKVVADTESICNITTRNLERAEANAKLIVAAPELFEVLTECQEYIQLTHGHEAGYVFELHQKIVSAINKVIK